MNREKIPLGEKILKLIEESPFKNPLNFHREIVRRFGDGTIPKKEIIEACSNGSTILNELIKAKILKIISDTDVRASSPLEKIETPIRKIAKNDFEKIWPIFQLHPDGAIKQRRLYFVITYRGKRKHKDEVLHQIASALRVKYYELTEGTTSEPPAEGPSHGFFPYGPKSNDNSAFLCNLYQGLKAFKPQTVKILSRGSTIEENEVIEGKKCFKFVTLKKGNIDLVIKHRDGNVERITLIDDEGYKFDSGELHHFENKSKQVSKAFVVSYLEPA